MNRYFIQNLILLVASCLLVSIGRQAAGQEEPQSIDRSEFSGEFVGLEKAWPTLRFHRPVFLAAAGDGSGRIFVVEQAGFVRVFSTDSKNPAVETFLDISDRISRDGNEEGLLGFAFHPDYKNNGKFFVQYSSKRDRKSGRTAPNIVSSFNVSHDNPNRADIDSETVLMNILQPFANHNGGMLAFGSDGYFYVSLGDGGAANDPHGNGQNVQTLLGSILRIDVDHPSDDRAYGIPDDNPFLDHPNARPELYAIGLRNVWRFSFDRKTDDLWAADVGQHRWEEVDLIKAGGNYGWNRMEGKADFRQQTQTATENLIAPIATYGREWGGSVTGGYAYRGKRFPQLDGDYFFGDYMTGNLWRIQENGDGNFETELVRRTGRSIASFGEDDDGELFLLSFDGNIYRIVPAEKPDDTFDDWPEQLADTGLFTSVPGKKLADHAFPYTINAPFWSDAATKTRYLVLPIGESLKHRDSGSWEVPIGSTIIKNFAIEGRKGPQMVETRLIKRTDQGWQAATYVWDEQNKIATLQVNGMQTERRYAGGVQSWHAPSASECRACHVEQAGFVLGLTTAQLNHEFENGENQIEKLATAGLVELPDDFQENNAAQFCSPFDESCDLNARVRIYLDVNCAMCHRPEGPGNANIDLRYETPLEDTKTVGIKPAQGTLGVAHGLLIAPGEPDRSLMLHRVQTRGAGRMPNIGTNMVDEEGVELLKKWIKSLESH